MPAVIKQQFSLTCVCDSVKCKHYRQKPKTYSGDTIRQAIDKAVADGWIVHFAGLKADGYAHFSFCAHEDDYE